MCGRFALDDELDELITRFVVAENRYPDWRPRFNISPGSPVPIVIERTPGARELGPATWSLIPAWSKTPTLKYPTFNARSETAGEKPTFRESVKKHRCVIPMSGYYEWALRLGVKTPHYVSWEEETLAAAGLYTWWSDPETGVSRATATILTRDAESSIQDIHERMPVFVDDADLADWLDPENTDGSGLIERISETTKRLAARLRYYPVAPLRGEGAELIQEVRG